MRTITDPADRTRTPLVADEKETLLALLAFQRDTLRWKCTGLTAEQLAHQHSPSTLTLGGLVKHLAVVEAGWVNLTFAGLIEQPSWWDQYQQDGSQGWTFRTAGADSPEQLFAWLDESQQLTERVVTDATDLDALAQGTPDDRDPCSPCRPAQSSRIRSAWPRCAKWREIPGSDRGELRRTERVRPGRSRRRRRQPLRPPVGTPRHGVGEPMVFRNRSVCAWRQSA